jgi:hypothetical protein
MISSLETVVEDCAAYIDAPRQRQAIPHGCARSLSRWDAGGGAVHKNYNNFTVVNPV